MAPLSRALTSLSHCYVILSTEVLIQSGNVLPQPGKLVLDDFHPLPNQGTIRGALKDSGVHFISSDGLNRHSASLTSAGLDLKPKSSKE